MRFFGPALLILFVLGCASVPGEQSQKDTAVKALNLDFSTGHELVSTVQRLMEESREGQKTIVKIEAQTTVGWGCPCPDFVYANYQLDGLNLSKNPEGFFAFQSQEGVPDINNFLSAVYPKGRFHVTGYYTGEVDGAAYSRMKPRRHAKRTPGACKFVVMSWCYEPPVNPEDGSSKAELEELRKKGVPWCGAPPPVCDPKVACEGTCAHSDRLDGCGGFCHNHKCAAGQKCNYDEGLCVKE